MDPLVIPWPVAAHGAPGIFDRRPNALALGLAFVFFFPGYALAAAQVDFLSAKVGRRTRG